MKKIEFNILLCLFLIFTCIGNVYASTFSVDITNTKALSTEITAFTFELNVSNDFHVNSVDFGNAIPKTVMGWSLDKHDMNGNDKFEVGAADWAPLFSLPATGIEDGTLFSIDYDQGSIDCSGFNFIKITGFDGRPVDLYPSEIQVLSFDCDKAIVGAPVPIPAAVWLLGAGLAGLFGFSRRNK